MGFWVQNIGSCLLTDQNIFRDLLKEFPLPKEYLLPAIKIVQKLLTSIFKGPEQHGYRNLSTSVDPNIQEILLIKFEIDPGSPVRDDAGIIKSLSTTMRLDLVLIEKDPGDRWSWLTMTRSVPLMMKVPLSVMRGISPK
jgi:hypothetical protein